MSDIKHCKLNPFKLEDFKLSDPPPALLFKYMAADRVYDVLGGGMVRFTHLLDTNDSFEVRKTFQRFAGPKLVELLTTATQNAITPEYIDQCIQRNLDEAGIDLPVSVVREVLQQQHQVTLEDALKELMGGFVEMFTDHLDEVKSPEEFLTEIGSAIMCFSLSERYDIPPMWAHYAQGHTGVVVAFNTENPWFKDDLASSNSKLQQIKYLDEQKGELFEDLQAAFSSKGTDWAYEREWRLNCAMKQIEKTILTDNGKIYLRSFPPEAVSSVIVGSKALPKTVKTVREILDTHYPHAKLQRATPQPMKGSYLLEDI